MNQGAASGYLPLARKLEHSPVWQMGPTAIQLWIWLLMKAVWKPQGETTDNGRHIKRGQLWTTHERIQAALKYKKGKGFKSPSVGTIYNKLQALKAENMIENRTERLGEKRYCQMLWMKVVRPLGVMGPWKRAYPGDPWV